MADHTRIEWTDATWNPITGCTLVSDGCRNCYAAQLAATRLKHHPSRAGLARLNADGVAKFTGEVRFNAEWLDQPLRWQKPRMIFVCAHGDLFHESVPDEWIDRVFAVMALAPRHIFQVLTKRPERMRAYVAERLDARGWHAAPMYAALMAATGRYDVPDLDVKLWPLPNVWLGTSVEDQVTADKRIPELLATPAAIRWISAEPLLGSLDLTDFCNGHYFFNALTGHRWHDAPEGQPIASDFAGTRLDWVVVGGESGRNARPMHPGWVRSLRNQCAAAGVPFLFKQWGHWAPLLRACPVQPGQPVMAAWPDGSVRLGTDSAVTGFGIAFYRGTKQVTGRYLDGVEHNAFPEVAHG